MKNQYPGVEIPYSPDLSPLLDGTVEISGKTLANRIVIQPIEGGDGEFDGSFGELTVRRYRRYAAGGAGLIWLEAVAVVPEGRATPRQLYLCDATLDSFKRIVEDIKSIGLKENGFEPVVLIQLTHSGRWSKPEQMSAPMIAYENPEIDKVRPLPNAVIVSDEYCKKLEEMHGKAAALAEKAGFDGADIKGCHGYLLSEMFSAYSRPGSYGGSFDNRMRLILNCFAAAKAGTTKNFILMTRMNAYDGLVYPWGFGVNEKEGLKPDLTEPLKLIDILTRQYGMPIVNITAGVPYLSPHITRPANTKINKIIEDPLKGVERILGIARDVQRKFPDLPVVASGFAYLQHDSFAVAAGVVKENWATLAGFARQSLAYPNFAAHIRETGNVEQQHCIACGKCSELLRAGAISGCVVRDSKIYAEIYRKHIK